MILAETIDLSAIFQFIDRYGLALVGFAVFVLGLRYEWIVWGSAHKTLVTTLQRETTREAELRQEERNGRLDAERRLDKSLEVTEQATDLASRYEQLVREKIK